MTIIAHKGKKDLVLIKGNLLYTKDHLNTLKMMMIIFLSVEKRTFVCEKTFNILQQNPYKGVFEFINENEEAIDLEKCCDTSCGC